VEPFAFQGRSPVTSGWQNPKAFSQANLAPRLWGFFTAKKLINSTFNQ
jgi:hypothetical protein